MSIASGANFFDVCPVQGRKRPANVTLCRQCGSPQEKPYGACTRRGCVRH